MQYGRPTTDPKGESMRVRLNTEMKQWLFKQSEKTGISVSQIIRDSVYRTMKESK